MRVENRPQVNWWWPVAVIGIVGTLGFLMGLRGDPFLHSLAVAIGGSFILIFSMPFWVTFPIEMPPSE